MAFNFETRIRIVCLAFLLFICGSLTSCGGGGGGGGGGNQGSAATGVRVLHGGIDAAPVTISSSASAVSPVQTARFAQPNLYAELNRGPQILSLQSTALSNNIRSDFEVQVENRNRFTVLIFGSRTTSLGTSIFNDGAPEIAEGKSAIRLIHAVFGASQIGMRLESAAEPLRSINHGDASNYILADPVPQRVVVFREADGRTIFTSPVQPQAGRSYSIFVTGQVDYYVTGQFLED